MGPGALVPPLPGLRLLARLTGGSRVWYGTDRQASVRQTLNDGAAVLGTQ